MEALYDAAAALDAAERTRFINEQCAGEEDLRRELMAAFGDAGSGLTGIVEHGAAAVAESDDNWAGRRMGPYRIERPLGRGGMGAVYLAIRDDDEFHKEVAIKTLKFELGGSERLRFRHERQILAHLEHPHIARLLDGGTTEHGTPYIVLEYVAGVEITAWCEQQQLSIEQRLRLFRQVCEAVQYAHQHLVVHRDIKPGNILVTPDGVPKLLDFGIAKLLDSSVEMGPQPIATATGVRLMTPDYASPEQVRGEAVSTATDVYSLGAVLYQLLTGQRPHALRNYDAVEIARVVCQAETRPPSALGDRRLRGDLDNIVLKAMHKDPARRYASVVEMSEDIRRQLAGLPITARADTTTYRAVKFVRRHRLGVAAVVAVVAALAAGVAVSLHEARVAERRFSQVRELANTFLFQFYDEVTPLPGSTKVRASIVDTARKYLDGLAKEAGNDKGLILELAQAYQRLGTVQSSRGASLGQLEQARRSYRQSLDLYARLPVDRSSSSDLRCKIAGVLYAFERLEYDAYREDLAEPMARRMLDLLEGGAQDSAIRVWHARAESDLAEIRLRRGDTTQAQVLQESARKTLLDLQSSGYRDPGLQPDIDNVEQRLAKTKISSGDLDGAASLFQKLLERTPPCDQQSPPTRDCRNLGVLLSWTGDLYGAMGRPSLGEPEKAAVFYQQALDIEERVAAQDSHNRQAQFNLAARCGKLGDAVWRSDPMRALALYERALTTARALASREQFHILREAYLEASSRPLIQLGRTAEARRAVTELMELARTDPVPTEYADRLGDLTVRTLWPRLLAAEGKLEEARRMLKALIQEAGKLRAEHTTDLGPVNLISSCYRNLASITTGPERREALLRSAAAWHSWPATSFTRREEQKDLAAANR